VSIATSIAVAAVLAATAPSAASAPSGAGGEAEPRSTATPTLTATAVPEELTLDAALAELDRQNLTLAQARDRARAASAVVTQVASPLVPTVTASGQYLRNRDALSIHPGVSIPGLPPVSIAGLPPGGTTIQPLEQFSGTLSVRIPLVVPTSWYDVSQARGASRAANASAEATRLTLRAGFAQAAYSALAAEEVVVAAEQALTDAAELTRSAQRRVQAGTSAPLDTLKARTDEVSRRSDLVAARAAVDRSRLALGVLLGREGPVRVTAPELGPAPAPAGADGRDAPSRRLEVIALKAQVDSAEAGVRASWARLAPQLSLSGAAYAADVPYPTGKKDGWRLTLDLTWQLWDGGLQLGKRRQAEAAADEARAAVEAERLAVLQEAQDTSRDLVVAREQLDLADQRRALAAETAASARRSFEAGVASSLDVIDANDRLFTAGVNLAAARARLAQSSIALDHALGRDAVR
jgi:outer membrane protein TolC